ncbi:stage II sporulation protein P [Niallia sp. NCCP-28]|uniref:stage II sporulation protein P n=1 Tax=Niallia sp. NCCP-28 TaxID=2934712 RepID=UPI002082D276|nr:stage II sporulation protein P [Niallia sp. NCCP-28]GKU80793.1 hypothetical protein NCCP28_01890 [Niallia sp. NCCP-28]
MQNEKDLFEMIKNMHPKSPNKEFIIATENKLRQKARSMKRKLMIKKVSAISSGVLFFAFAFSWLFLFSGKEVMTNALYNLGEESFSILDDNRKEKNPLVFIYHSHNTESFIPELNVKSANEAISDTKNVTLIGKELSRALKENNISTIHDDTDVAGILKERNLSFLDSYIVSREVLQDTLKDNKSIAMIFDIHRDFNDRKTTTINIEGKDFGRIVFVVSKTSDNYEANREFAMILHKRLEELYPGLSRGVVEKGVNPRNTYNQDVQKNSVLLEIGGVENTLEEAYRTTDILAEIIKETINEKES